MPRAKPKPLIPGATESQVMAAVVDAALVFGLTLDRNNTGAALNPKGKLVTFGQRGNPDLTATLPPPSGRRLDCEVKAESFDPAKLRGAKREHFDRQIERMTLLNARGGVAFWVSDVRDFVRAMEILRDDPGASVTFDADGHPRFTYKEANA